MSILIRGAGAGAASPTNSLCACELHPMPARHAAANFLHTNRSLPPVHMVPRAASASAAPRKRKEIKIYKNKKRKT
ncbi:hypothetical protein TIFTF001_038757 [Ficus carica]|uniref:Uncharacterized protein n=1 Tax=Ficus carica TaxID=3494 RepID=A0AA88JA96_FICCA|nr:hypothetical protein TIFTF001_038755 [Ficus carica]GMN69711.1 hypothetical protein TIFTF001_038757 [Ficus carica]